MHLIKGNEQGHPAAGHIRRSPKPDKVFGGWHRIPVHVLRDQLLARLVIKRHLMQVATIVLSPITLVILPFQQVFHRIHSVAGDTSWNPLKDSVYFSVYHLYPEITTWNMFFHQYEPRELKSVGKCLANGCGITQISLDAPAAIQISWFDDHGITQLSG